MKLYKSFVAPFVMAMAMMGCSTEDLQNEMNDLTDKVAQMEAQVQKLNDNMNILRIALDGNKTIQKVTENGDGSYDLLLSDGSTIVLTQGVAGSVFYPSVSVDGEGYWVIDGEKQDVKAKAENGQDGVTPKFQLKAEGNKYFWQVSYDNGKTFEFLLVDGKKVQANVETSILPSEEGPISDVKVENGLLSFKCGDQPYSIAIIENLKCIINLEESQMEEGYWMVPKGGSAETTVEVSGDVKLIDATKGWKAEYVGADKVKVTAPAETGATGVVTLQVNKGMSWVIERIQVKTKFIATSNYEKYSVGMELMIGNVAVKKVDDQHVSIDGVSYELPVNLVDKDTEVTVANGVYFVEKDAKLNFNVPAELNHHTLVVIGNDFNAMSTVTNSTQIKMNKEENAGNILFKNINADFSKLDNYPLMQNAANVWKNVIFDNCEIRTKAKRPLTYISSSNRGIDNIMICNSVLPFDNVTEGYMLININGSTSTDYNMTFVNNVVYSKKGLMGKYKLFNSGTKSGGVKSAEIKNNLFVNVLPLTEGLVRSTIGSLEFENNVIWFDAKTSENNNVWFRNSLNGGKFEANSITGSVKHNIGKQDSDASRHYQIFFGGVESLQGAEDVTTITESPFEVYDLAKGQFTMKADYVGYGPQSK